ncbi:hypothetical protein EVAR_34575_1 [Eumeta japonica]|uniref:Uncharacterized protein n=1 Tax=Eumeta variegata TaxID=151549 RepID=A0A4C1ZA13_EUMVA|nr:hypothetical protein EVAR_34575_1 [Eumeta japonica]
MPQFEVCPKTGRRRSAQERMEMASEEPAAGAVQAPHSIFEQMCLRAAKRKCYFYASYMEMLRFFNRRTPTASHINQLTIPTFNHSSDRNSTDQPEGAGYLIEGESATGTLTHPMKCNSASCYVTAVFCERCLTGGHFRAAAELASLRLYHMRASLSMSYLLT